MFIHSRLQQTPSITINNYWLVKLTQRPLPSFIALFFAKISSGVVILHLLLIPGTAFLAGGAQIWEQDLHPHQTQLNLSLLTIGLDSLLSNNT